MTVRRREGYRWTMLAEDHRSVAFGHEEDRWAAPEEDAAFGLDTDPEESPHELKRILIIWWPAILVMYANLRCSIVLKSRRSGLASRVRRNANVEPCIRHPWPSLPSYTYGIRWS